MSHMLSVSAQSFRPLPGACLMQDVGELSAAVRDVLVPVQPSAHHADALHRDAQQTHDRESPQGSPPLNTLEDAELTNGLQVRTMRVAHEQASSRQTGAGLLMGCQRTSSKGIGGLCMRERGTSNTAQMRLPSRTNCVVAVVVGRRRRCEGQVDLELNCSAGD